MIFLDNLTGSHHQSQVKSSESLDTDDDFRSGCRTSVTTTDNSPSQDYTHPDDQSKLLHVTPGFKPFTINTLSKTEALLKILDY